MSVLRERKYWIADPGLAILYDGSSNFSLKEKESVLSHYLTILL